MGRRVVTDTNVYVSRFIRAASIPGLAVIKAVRQDQTLVSMPIWMELRIVLHRSKFTRYTGPGLLDPYLRLVWMAAEIVLVSTPIRACRDARDDKFLEVAVHGKADLIVTGDRDLLDLNPFRGIAILTPSQYLELE